jgi:hypothetical protein
LELLLEILVVLAVLCSVAPATLFVLNLRRYALPRFGETHDASVAVLIPARDEERGIAECLEHVLASREVTLEVWVLDDDSADRTANIVRQIMQRDGRVRLLRSGDLPRGWNGKQYACWLLARYSTAPLLLFLDAGVRLSPWAIARCIAARQKSGVALLSGFPRQITVGWMEWMLLPLIQFVLLSFLPMHRMRASTDPAYAAGCGQFMLLEREAYLASGGHAAIRETRHDGLRLPQLLRKHGYSTNLVDLTTLAQVRMYESPSEVWLGLAKNATEGLAAPRKIVPFTLLLMLGQVVPLLLVLAPICILLSRDPNAITSMTQFVLSDAGVLCIFGICIAGVASMVPRLLAVGRFKQPLKSALLHPIAIVMLLLLQWYALARQVVGRPVGWRSRNYSSSAEA